MKIKGWQLWLGAFLVVLSALTYGIHYLIFHDAHHIFIYLIGDVAFVFIEVLLVTLIIHSLLERKEKSARLQKLNMVIGAFFSDAGTPLIKLMAEHDPEISKFQFNSESAAPDQSAQLTAVNDLLTNTTRTISTHNIDWQEFKSFLSSKRSFFLRLLENQNMLEHEKFTDLLWAVFHLTEELEARDDFHSLPDTDLKHLRGDMERAYRRLTDQWSEYMDHLKAAYPYLYSLALRTNPFLKHKHAIITE